MTEKGKSRKIHKKTGEPHNPPAIFPISALLKSPNDGAKIGLYRTSGKYLPSLSGFNPLHLNRFPYTTGKKGAIKKQARGPVPKTFGKTNN